MTDAASSQQSSESTSQQHNSGLNSGLNSWLRSEPGMLLELAINKAIRRDPVAMRRLAQLQGRSLRLTLTLPAVQLAVVIGAEGVSLVAAEEVPQPDCDIEGAPSDLLALLLDPQLAFDNRVQLRGNTQLANQLREIAQQLDLDWGGLLGDQVGDVAAQLLLNLFKKGRSVLHDGSENLLDDLNNWLHEEIRVQPCRAEMDHFYDQVDQLKLDAERLQARIEQLSSSA